jgi:hypothetical protein
LKKVIAAVAFALMLLGLGASAVQADPSVTLCHDVHVVVNGEDVVNDAACNVLPQ